MSGKVEDYQIEAFLGIFADVFVSLGNGTLRVGLGKATLI